MIYGQHGAQDDAQHAGSVWSIAMSTAMGNGIVPRAAEDRRGTRAAPRWPWSRTRTIVEPMVVAPRA
ncbi:MULTISPECIES: hypothetical protein [unclassified Microbacterium]|uniref:hypothetical protein n=1 Tax=unclassified Microbacterium TaxID=2609290 RepID=UPI0006FF4DDF|nr:MULTISPECIES: hypothetical protein [unclassified Microbacterium]KQT71970.1 hypothetical protein ASG45_13390 [Microbacterium sp. Leaf436]MBD8206664.1 hypothetical protein [Microbacterium sp. CFBP 8801]MBD8510300.1 hypothetical protein [Microbacterium sp. CFBP 8790]